MKIHTPPTPSANASSPSFKPSAFHRKHASLSESPWKNTWQCKKRYLLPKNHSPPSSHLPLTLKSLTITKSFSFGIRMERTKNTPFKSGPIWTFHPQMPSRGDRHVWKSTTRLHSVSPPSTELCSMQHWTTIHIPGHSPSSSLTLHEPRRYPQRLLLSWNSLTLSPSLYQTKVTFRIRLCNWAKQSSSR